MRLKEGEEGPGELSPLTADQLRELLEKSVEINIDGMAEGDLASTIGLFLSNLEKEAGTPIPEQKVSSKDGTPVDDGGPEEGGELPQEVKAFYYDEWDFRAADYKPGWCCVQEQILEEGSTDFFEDALREHSALVAETQRQTGQPGTHLDGPRTQQEGPFIRAARVCEATQFLERHAAPELRGR